MAGKTAPPSLMQYSHVCTHGVCSRPDCVGDLGPDGNVTLIKPCSSAPNIDLLRDAEPSRVTRSSEAEDILRLQEVEPNCRSIPRIVIVRSNDEELTVLESCAADTHQPDIVQSTKSGSLPRQGMVQPMQPVAPPRRKKVKTPSPLLANAANEVLMFTHIS